MVQNFLRHVGTFVLLNTILAATQNAAAGIPTKGAPIPYSKWRFAIVRYNRRKSEAAVPSSERIIQTPFSTVNYRTNPDSRYRIIDLSSERII